MTSKENEEYLHLCRTTKGLCTAAEDRLIAAVCPAAAHTLHMANEYRQRAAGTPNERKARRCLAQATVLSNVADSLEQDVLQAVQAIAGERRRAPVWDGENESETTARAIADR